MAGRHPSLQPPAEKHTGYPLSRLGSPPGGLPQPPLAAVCLLGRKAHLHPLKQLLRGSTDSLRQRAGSGGAGSPLLLRKQLQIHCPGVFSPVPCACTRAPGPSGRHRWVPRAQHFVALPTPQMTTRFLISKPWSGQGPENKLTPSPLPSPRLKVMAAMLNLVF